PNELALPTKSRLFCRGLKVQASCFAYYCENWPQRSSPTPLLPTPLLLYSSTPLLPYSLRNPMPYQSPISPGYSWYEDTAGPRPDYPALDGDLTTDVVI